MLLSPALGMKIISEVKTLIDEQLIVIDTDGTIIASTEKSRIGNFHEGGKFVSATGEYMVIHQDDVLRMKGVQAGINLPVLVNGQVVGVIGITGDPEEVNPFGLIVKKMTELLIKENYFYQQTEWENRMLDSFIYEWVETEAFSEELVEKGALLGVDINVPRRCAVFEIGQKQNNFMLEVSEYVHSWLKSYLTGVVGPRSNGRFIILHEADSQTKEQCAYLYERLTEHVAEKYQVECRAGLGEVVAAENVNLSFQQAEQALKSKNANVIFYEDLLVEICLNDINQDTKEEFIRKTIGPLLAEKELLLTLQTFFRQNMNVKSTATTLHVHINTVHYRLAKIQELTTFNTKESSALFSCYLALRFLDEHPI